MSDSKQLVIIGVGDIMLGDGIQKIRRGVRAAWAKSDSAQLLGHLKPVFSEADLVLGNLECALGDVDARDPRQMVYKGSPAHLPGLRQIGFTHFSLANNHILEHGLAAAQQTRRMVQSAGIEVCCGPNPVRTVCRGISIDLFTFNLIHDTPHMDFYRDCVTREDLAAIQKSNAQVKIICIHWGDEYSHYPSPEQIELAHQLVDHGACLVLGHHPHVVQGVETYRDAVIAYSLGNFVFDMDWSERTRSSFILRVEMEKTRAVGWTKIFSRQDDSFVPRLVSRDPEADMLDRHVLRFQNDPSGYRAYSRKKLMKSRLQALFHLCTRFPRVDRKTWEALLAKRFRKPDLAPAAHHL
jgi:gamma-polyglutamate biosynthesis protein CapA